MNKYSLSFALFASLFFIVSNSGAQTPTTVFSDNFDHAAFNNNTAYGSPACTYKITTGGPSTVSSTLVSGANYMGTITGSTNQSARFSATMAPYLSPFSRILSANVGLITWTFNMRTNTAVTSTAPATGVMAGGVDLCSNAGANIFTGAPTGYGVVFNSTGTGGVSLVKFNGGLNSNVVLITQTTTMTKTNFYSVRVTYNPATNQWSLFVRDDGAAAFADPSSGVVLQQGSTVTDNTYTNIVMNNYGVVYSFTTGAAKTMFFDNYKVVVTVPPCSAPGAPTGLSYANTATTSTVSFAPPSLAPTGYILVKSNGPLVGLPTTGQAVTPGTAVGSNGVIAGVGATSPVTASSLTANTNYTMTLFPYNNTGCTGGPVFNTAVSSTNITTCPNAPTLTGADPVTSNSIPNVTWADPLPGGGVYTSYSYLLNVYTDAGLTISAPGYPPTGTVVTSPYTIGGLTPGVTYWYTITAVDPACNSAPSAAGTATTSIVPCSGTPTSGTATSSSTMVTGGTPFTLGLIGSSGETGINYQWQSSSCNSTWTNIGGVTSSFGLTTTEATPTFYRCIVTCTNSGISNPSSVIFVGRVAAAYCNPLSTNGCSAGDGVNSFTLTGACGTSINDPGPMLCGSVNVDHTSYAPVKLYAGSSYPATINSVTDGDDVYVWIDFNNNGTFDATELIFSTVAGDLVGAPYFYSFNIPIPTIAAGATPGVHRMRVIANNAQAITTGCTTLTFGTSVDYMVQILPNVALSYNAPICLPGTALTLTANPAIACGAVYTWAGPSGYSNTTSSNFVSPPAVDGTYSVSVSVNGVNSCPSPTTTSVTTFVAASITGITGMCVGSTATLSGLPAGGVWASSNSGITTVGTSTGVITGIALGSATISYTIPTSGCFATSTIANTPTPSVFSVSGGGAYCSGGTGVHVGLTGSGVGVSYQLFVGLLPTGPAIIGTGSSLDFGFQTTAGTYTVVANPGTSCATNMAGSAVVSVNPLPTIFNMTGGGAYCPLALGVHVGIDGSQTGVNYQLYANGVPTGPLTPGTGTAIDFGFVTTVGNYNVVATNPATTCTRVMAGIAVVTLNSLPTLYTVTGGGSYCLGGTGVHVGLNGSAPGVSYQLYLGLLPVGLAVTGTGVALDFGTVTGVGNYTVVANDPATSCNRNMIGSVSVSTNPLPSVFSVTGGGSFCEGGSGVHVGLSGSVVGTNYYLYNGPSLIIAASGTGLALDFGLLTLPGTYTVTATIASTGCATAMSGSATVTMNLLPTSYNVTGGGPYCAGGSGVHVGLSNSTPGINYQLYLNGVASGAAVPGTGTLLDFGLKTAPGVYTVVATNAGTGCNRAMGGSVTISVNPLPSIFTVTGGGGYCTGGTGVHIGLNGSTSGVNYQLYQGLTPMGTPVAGTGSTLDFGLQTVTGSYTITAIDNVTGCTNSMFGTVNVAINPLPAVNNVTGGGPYCAGGTGVHIGLNGSVSGTNYQLYNGLAPVGGPIPGSGSPLDFGLKTAAGTYTVVATTIATSCSGPMSGVAVMSISPLPALFTVLGGGSYCAGGGGLSVILSGSVNGVNYQLYRDGLAVGSPVTGTGSALTFGPFTTAGVYTVVATDPATTCVSNMTGSATISINPLPAPFAITGGGNYCIGGTGVDIGLLSSVVGINYQLNLLGLPTGPIVNGSSTAITFGLQTTTGTYSVMATNATTGCSVLMPGTVTVGTLPLPASHTLTGGGNYCPGGAGSDIGIDGSNAGVNYQLYDGFGAVGSPVPGTGSPLDFGLHTSGNYNVIATNTVTGCTRLMSGTIGIGVASLPTVFNVTGGGSYCQSGTGVPVLLSGSALGTNYQLYVGTTAVGAPVAGTGLAVSFGLQTTAGTYTVVATNGTSCTATMAGSAVVTIDPLPTDYDMNGGGAYCAGGSGLHIGLSGSDAVTNYQLYRGVVTVGGIVAGTGGLIDFGLQTTAGTYTVFATNMLTGCSTYMTASRTIVVNPLPAPFTVGGSGSYCAGGTGLHVTFNGSATGINYQLFNGTTAVGSPIAGTGSALDFGLQTTPGTYTVTATDASSLCSGNMAGSAIITVNALPTAYGVSGGGNYCAGGSGLHVLLSGSSVGVSYQLYNGVTPAGATITGTGSSLDFGLQTAPGSYSVVATTVATGCVATMSGTVTINIDPLPNIYTVSGSATSYCSGGSGIDIQLSSSQAGVSYQLYRGTTPVGIPLSGAGGAVDFGNYTVIGTYTAIATDNVTGCSVNMGGSASISIIPLPTSYNVVGGGSYCSGGAGVHIGLSGSSLAIHYQLYRGVNPVGSYLVGTGSPLDFGLQTAGGVYTVVATNVTTTCTNTMNGAAIVSINPLPIAYTVTGGGNYCASGPGVHVGLSSSASGNTYQLYNGTTVVGGPVMGTGSALDFALQTAAGVYTVVATTTATGCTATMAGSASVVVNPLPATFAVTGGGDYCSGGAGVHVGIVNTATGYTYQLYNGITPVGVPTIGTGGGIDFGLQTTDGVYTVVAKDAVTHCTNTMSGSATVVVNPLPSLYTVTGGGSYCAGGTGVHVGLSNSGIGFNYTLYQGTTDLGTYPGSGGLLDLGLRTGAGTYTILASDPATGCSAYMTGSASVVVNPLVTPSVTISNGVGDTVCSGHTVTFTATAVNGGTTPAYQWSVNGVNTVAGSSFIYLPATGDLVGVKLTSSAACATPHTATNSMSMIVNDYQNPAIIVSVNPGTLICQGTPVTFTAVSTYGGTAPSYSWIKNGLNAGTGPVYNYIPANGDVVYCVLNSNYHCRLSDATLSAPDTIEVDVPATPAVTVSADPGTTVLPGQLVTFTATASNAGHAPTYQWLVNGNAILGAVLPTFTRGDFNNGDVITCEVLSGAGCSGIPGMGSVTLSVHNVGVTQVNNGATSVVLAPNPNKGSFTIKGKVGTVDEDIDAEITDMLGRVIYKNRFTARNGMLDEQLHLAGTLANGMYLLNLHTNAANMIFHIVVEQ